MMSLMIYHVMISMAGFSARQKDSQIRRCMDEALTRHNIQRTQ